MQEIQREIKAVVWEHKDIWRSQKWKNSLQLEFEITEFQLFMR